MKTRTLGNTGYRVSEIGFGGWGIGGEMWRGVDDADGRKALREAVEQGISFFDTALAYGGGHSERVIGETLKDDIRANRVVVATKIPPKNRQWPARRATSSATCFRPSTSPRAPRNRSRISASTRCTCSSCTCGTTCGSTTATGRRRISRSCD